MGQTWSAKHKYNINHQTSRCWHSRHPRVPYCSKELWKILAGIVMAPLRKCYNSLATSSSVHALRSVLIMQTLLAMGMFMLTSTAAAAHASSPNGNFGARREHAGTSWVRPLVFHHFAPVAGTHASDGNKITTESAGGGRQLHLGSRKLQQACERLHMSTHHHDENIEPGRRSVVGDADGNAVSTRQGFLSGLTSSMAKKAILATTVAGAMAAEPAATFSVANDRRSIQDIKKDVEQDFVTG